MGLYLGKKKLCSYDEKQITKYSMKMFFDAGGKFRSVKATSMDGWFLPSDTSNVTSMSYMFWYCSSLVSVPQMDTSNVTDMLYMFNSCSSLISVPQMDTSKVTNMSSMFESCYSLVSVPQMDTSKVTNMSYMFSDCSRLEEIHTYGMKVSFDISASTKFTESALAEILNNLASVTSTQTLTMGSTNLAKLTDEEKAIATGKGWTLK